MKREGLFPGLIQLVLMQSSQIEGHPLTGDDLKLVAKLGKLLTQRPQGPRGETMCHKVLTLSMLYLAILRKRHALACLLVLTCCGPSMCCCCFKVPLHAMIWQL